MKKNKDYQEHVLKQVSEQESAGTSSLECEGGGSQRTENKVFNLRGKKVIEL